MNDCLPAPLCEVNVRGFTLIELLVVMVIIAILAAIVIPCTRVTFGRVVEWTPRMHLQQSS